MKLPRVLSLTALMLAACSAPEPTLSSFTLHRPSSNPPTIDIDQMDKPIWSHGKSGEMIATAYVSYNNEQNAAKVSAWIRGSADNLELCYRIPNYTAAEMPPLNDPNVAYAAAAWIVPMEFRIHGLLRAPKQSTLSSCK